jgi:predicted TIM-barrel enzyme
VQGFGALIGSGLTVENAPQLLASASGAIVGTGIMRDGRIDAAKARTLAEAAARMREPRS